MALHARARIAGWRTDRRLGWLAIAAGALVVLAMQTWHPVGVPLYDGAPVQEPYRFLHPSGDEAGNPTSYSGQKAVASDRSPIFAAATSEQPPQAQLISQSGAFTLTTGATQVLVSITPIEAPPPPAGARIAGNVYRFSVTDQAGTPLDVRQCPGCLSLLMRAPDDTGDATVKRFGDGEWHDVETIHAGITGLFQSTPTGMGDFAVIETTATGDEGGLSPIVLAGGGLVIVLLALGGFLLLRVRQAPAETEPAPRTRVPSKRKGPRR
ncbi:MAG TPA: hypothetical protein VJ850_11140 [Candidatus Limnocylindrales bacterium]|nr:hypothetical protein [Candidatus Limnocylindrales bacterium]